jgi:hypothetical protein
MSQESKNEPAAANQKKREEAQLGARLSDVGEEEAEAGAPTQAAVQSAGRRRRCSGSGRRRSGISAGASAGVSVGKEVRSEWGGGRSGWRLAAGGWRRRWQLARPCVGSIGL